LGYPHFRKPPIHGGDNFHWVLMDLMNHEDIVRDWDLMDLYTNIYGLQWD